MDTFSTLYIKVSPLGDQWGETAKSLLACKAVPHRISDFRI